MNTWPWSLFRLSLLLSAWVAAFAQQPGRLTFDVASVKPADTNDLRMSLNIQPGGRVIASATLKALISFGYEVQDHNILGGPGWLDAVAWQIEAKSGVEPMNESALREMIRSLMEDRFHVAVRRDSREEPIYEMLVAKDGLKLKVAAEPGSPHLSNGRGRIGGKSIDTGILANAYGASWPRGYR